MGQQKEGVGPTEGASGGEGLEGVCDMNEMWLAVGWQWGGVCLAVGCGMFGSWMGACMACDACDRSGKGRKDEISLYCAVVPQPLHRCGL